MNTLKEKNDYGKLTESIESLNLNFNGFVEHIKIMAKFKKENYDALIGAGFYIR